MFKREKIKSVGKQFQFIPSDSLHVNIFHGLNNIDSISTNYDRHFYFSKNGTLSKNRFNNIWCVDTSKNYRLQRNSYFNVDQNYPKNYLKGAYNQLCDRANNYGYEIALMGHGSEGGYGWRTVTDSSNNIVLNNIESFFNSIGYDENLIHLGSENGFSTVDRMNHLKSDYIILPSYSSQSTTKVLDDKIFIATNYLGIQLINIEKDSVAFWNFESLIALFPKIKRYMPNYVFPVFTNFLEINSTIYIGAHIVHEYPTGYTRNPRSIIFTYSLINNKWDAIFLGKFGSIGILAYSKGKLWYGGSHRELSEGDPYLYHGGFGNIDLQNNEITNFETPNRGELVLDIEFKDDTTLVRSGNEFRLYNYKINSEDKIIYKDTVNTNDYTTFEKKYNLSRFNIMKTDSVKFSDELKEMKFTPRIKLIDSSFVEKIEKYK